MNAADTLAAITTLRRGQLRPYPKLLARVRRTATKTPRKQTGEYQTNRESRWAIDPRHPDYATEDASREVELKLLSQLFEFDQAPLPSETEAFVLREVLGRTPVAGTYRCPVSGRALDFEELVEITDRHPRHGRSPYAVGHMKPLHHETSPGIHIAENVAWVHEQGNRVQGNLSVDETAAEVFRIADFHRRQGGLEWGDVERIAAGHPPARAAAVAEPQGEEV